jgi:hypothetical protein
MTLNRVALGALAVALLLLVVGWIRRVRLHAAERGWRPPELKYAELVYVERLFRIRTPIRLVARVDGGYRQPDGSIVLLELKTRATNQAYFSDVIELSAQRVAIEGQTAKRVADYGYVLVHQPGSQRRTAHRVKLLMNDELMALAKRREVVLVSGDTADYSRAPGLCRECAFLSRCRPPYHH